MAFVLTNTPVSEDMLDNVRNTATNILAFAVSNPVIIEVGGGAGELSMALAEYAQEVHCVEPSRALSADHFHGTRVIYHRGMYPNDTLAGRKFDVVVYRQVTEHVPLSTSFLLALRNAVKETGSSYIEFPQLEYIQGNCSIVDFHYPHVHYYCKLHIEFLFKKAGFEVVNAVSLKGGHDVGYILRSVPTSLADTIDINFEQNTMVRFAAELQVRRARRSVKMHALRGRTALYGVNAYSYALVGLIPHSAV